MLAGRRTILHKSNPYFHHLARVLLSLITITFIIMEQSSSYTIVIGLNPALQKRFILSSKTPILTPGNVHRASEIQQGIGGKGQDVYVALHCLSTTGTVTSDSPASMTTSTMNTNNNNRNSQNRSTTTTTKNNSAHLVKLAQFLGKGNEGDSVLSYFLNRYDSDMDLSLTIRTEEKLRICTTIINCENSLHSLLSDESNASGTELVEPSGTISPNEVEELRQSLKSMMMGNSMSDDDGGQGPSVRGICIMGSMPPGCPSSLYADLYRTIVSKQVSQGFSGSTEVPLCMIDSVVGLDHLFHEMNVNSSASRKTNMIKINMAELCKITGTKFAVQEVANAEIDQVRTAMKALYHKFPESRYALSYVAITNGMFPAFMVHVNNNNDMADDRVKDDIIYRFSIPTLSQLRIPSTDNNSDVLMGGTMKLFTIGAGDAVTASTLAAWEYLMNRKGEQRLDETVRASLLKRVVFGDDIANTAFSFGLACGTASCIEKENSVFNIQIALQLFEQMERPVRVI